jgi:hypothetical protein
MDPGEKLDSLDDIWRPEEREPAHVRGPSPEDIWGPVAPTQESVFVLPPNWLASAPRRRLRGLWITLGSLAVVAAAIVLLLLRMP